LRWVCEIQNRTSNTARGLNGRCPLERVTGESVDISEYLDFGFYDWVWYKENAGLGETKLGRWLGVSHRMGTLMSYWILTKECQVLSRTTVQRVTNLELQTEENALRCKGFNETSHERLGNPEHFTPEGKVLPGDWKDYQSEYDEEFQEEFSQVVNDPTLVEADDEFTPDMYDDTYLNMELALPRNGEKLNLLRLRSVYATRMGYQLGQHMIILSSTPGSMRSSSLTDTNRRWRQTPSLKTYSHKSMRRVTDTFCWTKSLITGQTGKSLSSKMPFLQCLMGTRGDARPHWVGRS
jgi:hypothetical protein